jgi:non-ribosomal peptide synthetase component F
MRNQPMGNMTVREFMGTVRQNTLEAFENADLQFEKLVEILNIPRDKSRNPLFDIMLQVLNIDFPGGAMFDTEIKNYEFENKTSKFDFELDALKVDNDYYFYLSYSVNLFKKETMERFSAHYTEIVDIMINDSKTKLEEIEIFAEETSNLLDSFNDDLVCNDLLK